MNPEADALHLASLLEWQVKNGRDRVYLLVEGVHTAGDIVETRRGLYGVVTADNPPPTAHPAWKPNAASVVTVLVGPLRAWLEARRARRAA